MYPCHPPGMRPPLLARRLWRRGRFGRGWVRRRLLHHASFAQWALAQDISHALELLIDEMVDRSGLVDRSRAHPRQSLDSAIDRIDRIDVEFAPLDRAGGLRIEHEVRYVGARHQHALRAGQTDRLAHAIEALDLLVDAANRLHGAVLIDRPRHRQVLPKRYPRQRRQQRVQLGRTGAVAVDSRVRLLEADAGRHRDRMLLSEPRADKPAQDHDSLVVRRSRHPRLALDVDHARLPQRHGRGYARRPPETVTADVQYGQPVDLSDARAANMNDERAFGDQPADFLLDEIEPQHPLAKRPLDVRAGNALRQFGPREVR